MQLLEPALTCSVPEGDTTNYKQLYNDTLASLGGGAKRDQPAINLVTYYDDLGENYEWVVQLPVQAVSLDFCGVVRPRRFFCACLLMLCANTECPQSFSFL